jgi:large subunit ribosomal protein L25
MGIEVVAQSRTGQGTGASRRLRHAGKVPGIVYGGKSEPVTIELEHNALYHQLRMEKFHASILDLAIDGKKEQVLLRTVNMHPWKPEVQHIDFQRVLADQPIHMKVPLHFVNAESSPAVKTGGAVISHVMNEIDVKCLPADLPEFIEIDLIALNAGQSIHVRDVKFPQGVTAAVAGDPVVAIAQVPRGAVEEEAAAAEAAPAASAVPAAKQPEKKDEGAPAKGGDAKGGGDKGGDKKK